MSNTTIYYELVRREIRPTAPGEFRIATAAVWPCRLCHEVIDGMGGPGNGEICETCAKAILGGQVQMTRTDDGKQ